MLEGLALWALFIFLLRKIGMPWNIGTQIFSYVGGLAWLTFVWIGMIAWSPMDMTGGAVVQAPHIQLRPESPDVVGKIENIYVQPNEDVKEGQLLFDIDDTNFVNQLNQTNSKIVITKEQLKLAERNLDIAEKLKVASLLEIDNYASQIENKKLEINLAKNNYNRLLKQSKNLKGSVTEADLDNNLTTLNVKKGQLDTLAINKSKAIASSEKSEVDIERAKIAIDQKLQEIETLKEQVRLLEWKIESAKITAPTDGFVTNFIVREGQFMGRVPRMHMYTEEKYVLLVINHQGIRNIKDGQYAEFATPVYPGKIFKGKVQSVIEATGESQGSLLSQEQSVVKTLAANRRNKFHFVRIELDEPEGYDIPLGSSGIGWIAAEKPHSALGFLDVIRGIIIRMKAQIYYVYSL